MVSISFPSGQRTRSGVSAERRQLPVSEQRMRRSAETPLRSFEIPSIFHLPSSILAVFFLAAMVARANERDVQFNRWFAAQTNLQSWSADFTQTRSLKVLSQPLVANGKSG